MSKILQIEEQVYQALWRDRDELISVKEQLRTSQEEIHGLKYKVDRYRLNLANIIWMCGSDYTKEQLQIIREYAADALDRPDTADARLFDADSRRIEWLLGGLSETEIRRKLQVVMDTYYMGSFKEPPISKGDFRSAIDVVMERWK